VKYFFQRIDCDMIKYFHIESVSIWRGRINAQIDWHSTSSKAFIRTRSWAKHFLSRLSTDDKSYADVIISLCLRLFLLCLDEFPARHTSILAVSLAMSRDMALILSFMSKICSKSSIDISGRPCTIMMYRVGNFVFVDSTRLLAIAPRIPEI